MQRETMIEVYKTTEKLSNEWNKAARHGEGNSCARRHSRPSGMAGSDMAVAAGEVVQPGQQRDSSHEIEERIEQSEVESTRCEKYDDHQRRQLNQGGSLPQYRR